MIADLHTHSTFSDGTYTPKELIQLAQEKNLSALALTDHDTISGLSNFFQAGAEASFETISGVELSVKYPKFSKPMLHILALHFPYPNPKIDSFLKTALQNREQRNTQIIQKLQALQFDITLEEVAKNAEEVVGRPHIAFQLIKKGYVKTFEEAFSLYLGKDKKAFVPLEAMTAKECISMIHEAGGVAILAHPTRYRFILDEMKEVCSELASYGLDGIEVYHSSYQKSQIKQLQKIATDFNFIRSGGSDFHGENKPDVFLGSPSVPYSYLEIIKEHAKRYKKDTP